MLIVAAADLLSKTAGSISLLQFPQRWPIRHVRGAKGTTMALAYLELIAKALKSPHPEVREAARKLVEGNK